MNTWCSNCAETGDDLKKCSRCKLVFYCSRECQANHWPRHKIVCVEQNQQGTSDKTVYDEVSVCGNCKLESYNLKKCSRCRSVSYCSKKCQESAWMTHKNECKKSPPKKKVALDDLFSNCYGCGHMIVNLKGVLRCKGCSSIYCTKYCLANDWVKHKYTCSQTHRKAFEAHMSEAMNQRANCQNKCEICSSTNNLKTCSRCHGVKYCCRGCQRKDWEKHKNVCQNTKKMYTGNMIKKIEIELKLKEVQTEHSIDTYYGCYGKTNKTQFVLPYGSSGPTAWMALLYNDNCDLTIYERSESERWIKALKTARIKNPDLDVLVDFDQVPNELSSDNKVPLQLIGFIPRYHHYRGQNCVYIEDKHEKELYTAFYFEKKEFPEFDWSQIKPGRFIIILNPRVHYFVDTSVGFKMEHPDNFILLND